MAIRTSEATKPDRWNNHWAEKCKNCRHQKRAHTRQYQHGVRGKLVRIGMCLAVDCACRGYTDGRYWDNGVKLTALIRQPVNKETQRNKGE